MVKNHVNNDGDSTGKTLPALPGNHLPSADGQIPFYEFQKDEDIQLRDYLDVMLRRKWLIMTVLALTFLSTMVFTLASTKIYEASAVVEVNQETPQVTKFEEVLASKVQAREFYETQVELICSRAMISRVIDKLNLTNHPVIVETLFGDGRFELGSWVGDIFKFFETSIEKRKSASAISEDLIRRQKMIKYIAKNLSARPSRNSMLIDVKFRSPDRQLSLLVVNTLA